MDEVHFAANTNEWLSMISKWGEGISSTVGQTGVSQWFHLRCHLGLPWSEPLPVNQNLAGLTIKSTLRCKPWVDSLSILFNPRSFQNLGFWFPENNYLWKEWGRYPILSTAFHQPLAFCCSVFVGNALRTTQSEPNKSAQGSRKVHEPSTGSPGARRFLQCLACPSCSRSGVNEAQTQNVRAETLPCQLR